MYDSRYAAHTTWNDACPAGQSYGGSLGLGRWGTAPCSPGAAALQAYPKYPAPGLCSPCSVLHILQPLTAHSSDGAASSSLRLWCDMHTNTPPGASTLRTPANTPSSVSSAPPPVSHATASVVALSSTRSNEPSASTEPRCLTSTRATSARLSRARPRRPAEGATSTLSTCQPRALSAQASVLSPPPRTRARRHPELAAGGRRGAKASIGPYHSSASAAPAVPPGESSPVPNPGVA
mmetsp:Transcript_13548/g.46817  ORF Transcript_13548/g.46817 Transcript_13548/m.46817 type:complete len:236 (-) Transcript_13548:86-793(-)